MRKMKISKEVENICIADAYITDNILYAAGFEWNMLFKFDMKSMEVKKIGEFTKFKNPYSFQNRAIFKFEESLFFVSINSYEIAEYKLKRRRFYYFNIESHEVQKEKLLVKSVCRVNDEIWIFQEAVNRQVVVFSMKTRKYVQHEINIIGEINHYESLDWESCISIGTTIWRCVPGSSDLLLLDTKSLREQVINTKLPLSFLNINCNNGDLYILTADGRDYVSFNTSTFEVNIYDSKYVGIQKYPFWDVIKIDNILFSLPCFEKSIFCYEIRGRELQLIKCIQFPEEFQKVHDAEIRSLFYKWKRIGQKLYLLPFAGNGMICLDVYSFEIVFFPIKIPEKNYLSWVLKNCPMQYEKQMNLKDYLKGLEGDSDIKSDEGIIGTSQGNMIWENLLQLK